MTSEVLFAVLLGAAFHASWNAAIKSGTDKFMDPVLLAGGAALIALVLLPFLPVPAVASWGYIAAAATAQVAYYSLVAAAYRAGDMSVAYPLMRGLHRCWWHFWEFFCSPITYLCSRGLGSRAFPAQL